MLSAALILFAVAMLGGLTLLILRIRERDVPLGLALLHGALAAAGLVVLIIAMVKAGAAPIATISLVIFLVAAVGGFAVFSFQLRGEKIPISLAFAHGALALLAFAILLKRVVLHTYGIL